MPVNTAFVKLEVQTPSVVDTLSKTLADVKGMEIMTALDSTQPDLVIYELDENGNQGLDDIQSRLDTAVEQPEFFIVSLKSDPDILIQAMRIGVKEFFPIPLQTSAVMDAVIRFLQRQAKKKKSRQQGKILSVIGSKGGVGTTTIAVNLADMIARKQEEPSVALLDMNMVFGDVPMFLDMSPKHHWGDITKNIARLDEVFLANVLTKNDTGLHLLPSPGFLDKNPMPTPEIMETLLNLMKNNFDYIVIDLGQSVNDTALKIVQLSEYIKIVAIQTLPCLSNANRLITSLVGYGYTDHDRLGIILNRYIKKGVVTLETAEEGLGKKLSWIIPNDYGTTMSAINSGKTLFETAPKSKIARSFNTYVERLLQIKKEKKGWFF